MDRAAGLPQSDRQRGAHHSQLGLSTITLMRGDNLSNEPEIPPAALCIFEVLFEDQPSAIPAVRQGDITDVRNRAQSSTPAHLHLAMPIPYIRDAYLRMYR